MQSHMHSPMQTRIHTYVPSSRGVAIEDDVKCWAEESFQLYATEEDGERQDKSTLGEQQQQQHKTTKVLKGNNIRYAIASVIGVEPRQADIKQFLKDAKIGTITRVPIDDDLLEHVEIDKESFVSKIQSIISYRKAEETIRLAFDAFDVNSEGFIRREVCEAIFKKYLRALPKVTFDEIFDEVDENGDGLISLAEFASMMFARIVI